MIHGSRTTFQNGCRCEECDLANRRYLKRYRVRVDSQGPLLADASEAAAHLRKIVRQGASFNRLGFISGIPARTLAQIANGTHKRTTPERITKILKLQAYYRHDRGHPNESIPSHGAIVRVRALFRVGYNTRSIADATKTSRATISRLLNGHAKTIGRDTHLRIAAAFDKLDPAGPKPPQDQRRLATHNYNIERAKKAGWRVPAAIENPDFKPVRDRSNHHSETRTTKEE